MRVSVIIPCYNLGRYLDEAVDSVLAQSFQDFEIVVVDDGSTEEETRRMLSDYRKPRTRVVRSANRGLPAAKNLGLAETAGPYVCMLDADDRLDSALLQKSVAALDADPSLAFVSHWLRTFGDEVWEWTPARCDLPALLDVNTVNGAALVRRSALAAVGGFDESMRDGCEDWDLWISLVERGFKGAILPEVLFYYRRRPESMSRVMMRGDGHPRLYRRLAEKHAHTYGEHIGPLLARREEDLSNLRRHVHDLELEHYRWLGPELAKWRNDVEVLERKAGRVARERAQEDERVALKTALEQSENDRRAQEDERAARERAHENERAALERARENERAALERAREHERAALKAALEQSETDRETSERRFEETQARSRAEAAEERCRADAALKRAHLEQEQVRAERDRHAQALDAARDRALELDASANRLRNEVDDLRRSVSWRVTAPFRALYGGVQRVIGRNRS